MNPSKVDFQGWSVGLSRLLGKIFYFNTEVASFSLLDTSVILVLNIISQRKKYQSLCISR